jgi:hypothetical protein
MSPPLADQLRSRSLMGLSKDPGELCRLGEDRIGGKHEARELRGTSELGGVLALWYLFKNRSVVMTGTSRPFGVCLLIIEPRSATMNRA